MPQKVVVLLPCYNEEATIGAVVQAFQTELPDAEVFVFDNNSSDATSERAIEAGAIVRTERLQGKGNVMRRMFADIDADVYVVADGDGSYDAAAAPTLVERLIVDKLDMVVATRKQRKGGGKQSFRRGHRLGNEIFTRIVGRLFGNRFQDVLSGYRALSRRYVKSFPALATGFEIETELNNTRA